MHEEVESTSMNSHYYAVIMAGGGGTRLWPLSRQSRPKQLLPIIEQRSLFQMAIDRLDGLFTPDHILVVTVQNQLKDLHEQCPFLPMENFLVEPEPRGTASVVGLAAVALTKRDPDAIMAVLTSDHYIGNQEWFQKLLKVAATVAQKNYLVTLGITPTYAATGYGYIQQGEVQGRYDGVDVYYVERFKEKPDELQAQIMLAMGDHTWNSGMFIWKAKKILEEIDRQMPALGSALRKIAAKWNTSQRQQVLEKEWLNLESQTIDYGIMEGARDVVVIPAGSLRWSDVGSWDSLFDVLPADANENIIIGGKHFGLDTRKSLVYVNQEHRLIVTIGVRDLVVVDTGDVLLICRKDEAQKVRHVVNLLKERGDEHV
ncbi:MAG: mannose-1-phosphate guanylyltransferase [Anaerolineales bacterium]